MQETSEMWVQSLGWTDPPEEGMATHCSILAWRIPWTEEPGGLQSLESQRVRHDSSDLAKCVQDFGSHLWKQTSTEPQTPYNAKHPGLEGDQ